MNIYEKVYRGFSFYISIGKKENHKFFERDSHTIRLRLFNISICFSRVELESLIINLIKKLDEGKINEENLIKENDKLNNDNISISLKEKEFNEKIELSCKKQQEYADKIVGFEETKLNLLKEKEENEEKINLLIEKINEFRQKEGDLKEEIESLNDELTDQIGENNELVKKVELLEEEKLKLALEIKEEKKDVKLEYELMVLDGILNEELLEDAEIETIETTEQSEYIEAELREEIKDLQEEIKEFQEDRHNLKEEIKELNNALDECNDNQ